MLGWAGLWAWWWYCAEWHTRLGASSSSSKCWLCASLQHNWRYPVSSHIQPLSLTPYCLHMVTVFCSRRITDNMSELPPHHITHTTTVLWPFFWDHPGEPVPEENFWTLWWTGRLTEADTLTIWLGATPSGLASAYLHHHPCWNVGIRIKTLTLHSCNAFSSFWTKYISSSCQHDWHAGPRSTINTVVGYMAQQ